MSLSKYEQLPFYKRYPLWWRYMVPNILLAFWGLFIWTLQGLPKYSITEDGVPVYTYSRWHMFCSTFTCAIGVAQIQMGAGKLASEIFEELRNEQRV